MSRLQIQDERVVDAACKVITSLLEDKSFCDHLDNLDMSNVSIKFFEEFLRMTRDHLISNGIRIRFRIILQTAVARAVIQLFLDFFFTL